MYGFRIYFTPLSGVLFTFPSRYLCTIGRQDVYSLARWSSQLPPGFHVSRGTRGELHSAGSMSLTRLLLSLADLSRSFSYRIAAIERFAVLSITPHNPMLAKPASNHTQHGLGRTPFARHYSGSRDFFLFLRVLRCFSSPGWHRHDYVFIM